jgi:YfiH family protein
MSTDVPEIISPAWPAPVQVKALATTRIGGLSGAPYDSWNLSGRPGDDPAAVAGNRQRLIENFGLPAEPFWLDQVHGTTALNLDHYQRSSVLPVADASFTREAGKVCVVQTADCLPILLAHQAGICVAAIHAGWRGLADGVIEATLKSLDEPGADILAWIGPAISQPHFEVGDEVRAVFIDQHAGDAVFFQANDRQRWQADLVGLARARLQRAGVENIFGGQWCTYADEKLFYSYRRAQHQGNAETGRQATLIWLDKR